MNYLLSYLTGKALKSVQGLKLSKPNYSAAIEMLQERYGDKQVLISTHMNKLLNLSNSGNLNDLKYLRQLYNNIDTQVRSLTSLGMDPDSYGPMLIPIVMSKLPENLKLNITRQFGQNLWGIKLKLVSAIFSQNFVFPPNDSPSKTMKSIFDFIKKALFVLEIFKLM